jgi:SPX domain protein involved in polyphosphate accumulation
MRPQLSSFAERRELVYIASLDVAETFAAVVNEHLALDPNNLSARQPGASHYVTSLYFDSASHEIAHACASEPDSTKLRAREYFDCSSSGHGIVAEALLWFEVKVRVGTHTRKVRFSIPTDEVQAFLSEGVISERMVELQRQRWGTSAEAVLEEIAKLCNRTAGPLHPDCVVHYRRRAWQDKDASTRVTLDTELAFYRAPANLLREVFSLREVVTGEPVLRANHCVIEIKLHGERPQWLHALIEATNLQPEPASGAPFSKFLAASRAVRAAERSSSHSHEPESQTCSAPMNGP